MKIVILLIVVIAHVSFGQAFLGKVYNNIVVSNDSNEEDSLVASSESAQGGGGGQGGQGRGGFSSGGRHGKSGAGGPSQLGKDIVVTTNGPKAKIIVRKSKGSKKSVGTAHHCSSCSGSAIVQPKLIYVPYCPHSGQYSASTSIPTFTTPQLYAPQLYQQQQELQGSPRDGYERRSFADQPPPQGPQGFSGNSVESMAPYQDPLIASSAQLRPQFHATSFLPPPPPPPPASMSVDHRHGILPPPSLHPASLPFQFHPPTNMAYHPNSFQGFQPRYHDTFNGADPLGRHSSLPPPGAIAPAANEQYGHQTGLSHNNSTTNSWSRDPPLHQYPTSIRDKMAEMQKTDSDSDYADAMEERRSLFGRRRKSRRETDKGDEDNSSDLESDLDKEMAEERMAGNLLSFDHSAVRRGEGMMPR